MGNEESEWERKGRNEEGGEGLGENEEELGKKRGGWQCLG